MNRIIVLGATGNIGRQLCSYLGEMNLKGFSIIALCGKSSDGKQVSVGETTVKANYEPNFAYKKDDIVISCLRAVMIEQIAENITEAGAVLIDTSSHFRADSDKMLIVPEVNGDLINGSLSDYSGKIITSPNCVAAPLVIALNALHKLCGIKRVVISTYQAVSGAGAMAMDELFSQSKKMFESAFPDPQVFEKQISFNCLPKIGEFSAHGKTGEEEKVGLELQKIMNLPDLKVSATCVRVPVFACHGMSVNVELEQGFQISEAQKAIQEASPLVRFSEEGEYQTQVETAALDEIFVSRFRRDYSVDNGLNFWLVSDNLRKGGALNAAQILKQLLSIV